MVIGFRKIAVPLAAAAIFIIFTALAISFLAGKRNCFSFVMGGSVHTAALNFPDVKAVIDQNDSDYSYERFRRPSNQPALKNPYSFSDFQKDNDQPPLITTAFHNPEEVVKAYYGILRNASNMEGYLGGCGSIGFHAQPYPYAYELYTDAAHKKMSFSEFVDSFRGIGYLTLLKLYPAYTPPETPENIRYFMFEAEAITGPSEKDEIAYKRGGSYFVYHYGLITVETDSEQGWKIRAIDYLPEDFLCAPEHGWVYLSDYFVQAVYHDWYHLIDRIDKTEQNGAIVSVYASGEGNRYRFDFVRLTNGYDILLHENIYQNGQWVETNLLKEEDQRLKLSILNQNLNAEPT